MTPCFSLIKLRFFVFFVFVRVLCCHFIEMVANSTGISWWIKLIIYTVYVVLSVQCSFAAFVFRSVHTRRLTVITVSWTSCSWSPRPTRCSLSSTTSVTSSLHASNSGTSALESKSELSREYIYIRRWIWTSLSSRWLGTISSRLLHPHPERIGANPCISGSVHIGRQRSIADRRQPHTEIND